jgi:hypothetical protein
MSEENVAIVRRFYEASQRSLDAYWRNRRSGLTAPEAGDLDPELEAVLSFLDPEVEYNAVPAVLWGGTARGHLGYLRSWGCVSWGDRGVQHHGQRSSGPRRQ